MNLNRAELELFVVASVIGLALLVGTLLFVG